MVYKSNHIIIEASLFAAGNKYTAALRDDDNLYLRLEDNLLVEFSVAQENFPRWAGKYRHHLTQGCDGCKDSHREYIRGSLVKPVYEICNTIFPN